MHDDMYLDDMYLKGLEAVLRAGGMEKEAFVSAIGRGFSRALGSFKSVGRMGDVYRDAKKGYRTALDHSAKSHKLTDQASKLQASSPREANVASRLAQKNRTAAEATFGRTTQNLANYGKEILPAAAITAGGVTAAGAGTAFAAGRMSKSNPSPNHPQHRPRMTSVRSTYY